MRALTWAVAAALVLSACGDGETTTSPTTDSSATTSTSTPVESSTTTTDSDGESTSSTADPTSTTAPATSSTTLPPVVGDPRTDPYTSPDFPASGAPGLLTTVRTESYDSFTRLVFEFDGDAPAFSIGYRDGPVRANPSGNPIEVQGDEFLHISLAPASGVDLSGDEPEVVYTGPERLSIDAEAVNELVKTEDFESHLSWAVGLDERLPYSFSTLDGPARVVIDLHLDGAS